MGAVNSEVLTLPALRFQDLGDFRFCDKPVANKAEIFGNGVLTVALKIPRIPSPSENKK